MICVSLANMSHEKCIEAAMASEMIELRLDSLDLNENELAELLDKAHITVASCRAGLLNEYDNLHRMKSAINMGVFYVDVDIKAPGEYIKDISQYAKSRGRKLIISYHDYDGTPSTGELNEIIGNCMLFAPDVIKIACQAGSTNDCARVLSLYSNPEFEGPEAPGLVAISMGDYGKISRLAALFLGSPFTYTSYESGMETAPGQFDKETLEKLIRLVKNG